MLVSEHKQEIMLQFINGLPEKLFFYIKTSVQTDMTEALSLAKNDFILIV